MTHEELTRERDAFWNNVHRRQAEEFFTLDASRHFDECPELQRAFCNSPRPTAAEIAAGKQRFIAALMKHIRENPSPHNPLR